MTKFLITAAMIAGQLPVSNAQAQQQYPFIAPKCPIAIVQPGNEGGYYMGEDCKSVFVLPAKQGEVEVQTFKPLANMSMCDGLFKAYDRVGKLEEQYNELLDRIANTRMSEASLAIVERKLSNIAAGIDRAFASYDGIPAATVWLSYRNISSNDWVGEYLKMNPNAGPDLGIRFYPAPIAQSILSFTARSPNKAGEKLAPVYEANINGVRPIDADPNQLNGDAVMMNGGISGALTLTLVGACVPKSEDGKPVEAEEESVAAHLVANLTYTVPMLTWADYSAEMNVDTAIRNFVISWQTKSKFTTNEAAEIMTSGTAGSAFKFESTTMEMTGGGPYSPEDRQGFFKTLRDEARERLAQQILDQMTVSGFLEMSEAAPEANAPEPGTRDEVHHTQSCKRSLFSKRCSNHTYTVKIPVDSRADVVLDKINNTNFTAKESVGIRETFYRVHTSEFAPVRK